jgi:uncharacterized membrane protein
MWGTLLIPILAYLIHARAQEENPNWKLALLLGLGFPLLLWAFSWLLGWVASFVDPGFVQMFLQSQGMTASELFAAASLRRLAHIVSLITLLAVLIPTLAYLFPKSPISNLQLPVSNYQSPLSNQFVFLILLLGGILILAPEFVYLRDQFGYRINTVFKFYYQAWMLWSLAAAFAVAWLFQNLKLAWNVAFRILTALVIFAGLLYPALGLMSKTENFNPYFGFTLDDFERIKRENPDEAAAIEFLQTIPNGVVAEAIGGSYQSEYARVATYTGLQNVLGWPGHEAQWRGGSEPQGARNDDIINFYSTTRWDEAQAIIDRYDIRYIFVGSSEYASMPVKEEKFRAHLKVIFQQGNVTVYEVP